MKVYITGFDLEEKNKLKSIILSLNLEYDENFTTQTKILICESVLLQKYKVAKSVGTKITNKKWLYDSQIAKEVLDTKNYEMGIFENLKISFFNFEKKILKGYRNILKLNKGVFLEFDEILENRKFPDIVVFEDGSEIDGEILKFKNDIYFVSKNWFLNCLEYNEFIFPERFLIFNSKKKSKIIQFRFKKEDLVKIIENSPVLRNLNMFKNNLFYIKKIDFTEEEIENQKFVINFLGGFYLNKKIKNTTHIIAKYTTKPEEQEIQKENKIIINQNYLYNCILYKKKLLEIEYPPHRKKTKKTLQKKSENSQKLKTFKSLQKETKPTFKSFLFENIYFHFHKTLPKIKSYQFQVLEHSGSIIMDISKSEISKKFLHKQINIIIPDGIDITKIKKKISSIFTKKTKTIFLSHRWIDYCIERKSVIKNLQKEGLPQLIAFPHKTPLLSFKGIFVSFRKFDQKKRNVLIDLIFITGATYVKFGDVKKGMKVFVIVDRVEGMQEREGCVFKPVRWIFECLQKGVLI